jgi:hypothetical protein
MSDPTTKRLGVVAASLGYLALAYALERHVVGPARQRAGETFDAVAPIWLDYLGWVVVAAAGLGLVWLLFVWAQRDRLTAAAVLVLGALVWAIVPLAYSPATGELIPNWLLTIVVTGPISGGPIGYVTVAAAWILVTGAAALLPGWRASPGQS